MAPEMVQCVPLPTPLRFPSNFCNRLAKLHDKMYAVEPNAMPSTSKPLDPKLFANRAASRTKTPSMCGPLWLQAAKTMHGSTRPTCSCIVGSGFGVKGFHRPLKPLLCTINSAEILQAQYQSSIQTTPAVLRN